jgi:hypothetical protein
MAVYFSFLGQPKLARTMNQLPHVFSFANHKSSACAKEQMDKTNSKCKTVKQDFESAEST